MRTYTPFVPGTVSELLDMLGFTMVKSPRFEDSNFPGRNLETVFVQLNDGLEAVRPKIGDERFCALSELARRMQAHFQSDPDDSNGEASAGRALIHEMKSILRGQ